MDNQNHVTWGDVDKLKKDQKVEFKPSWAMANEEQDEIWCKADGYINDLKDERNG